GIRGTRLLAGSENLTVTYAVLRTIATLLRINARGIDALHAVGAFLHHATAAHRDIRIASQFEAGRVIVREQKEVEAAHLIRTLVGAITGANATVVHHVIQPFGAVNSSTHR